MAVWASGGTKHYTAGVFKPLALNTLGFAFRVAAARSSPRRCEARPHLLKSRIGISLAKDGAALSEEEAPTSSLHGTRPHERHHERRQARRGVASRG